MPDLINRRYFLSIQYNPSKRPQDKPSLRSFAWEKGKNKMTIEEILSIMQLITNFGTICAMVYALYRFGRKPTTDLESRVSTAELEIAEIKRSLMQGNDRFREQAKTNEVLIRATLALLEFEVHYCETEQKPISKNLEKAKDDLNEYFSKVRA